MSIDRKSRLIACALLVLLCSVAAGPAGSQEVRSNYMPGVDFSKFKTYRWVAIEGASHPNQIVDAEIKSSVDKQLADKGLTKVDADSADLNLGYQVAVDKERQWNSFGSGGLRWGGMNTATSSRISGYYRAGFL